MKKKDWIIVILISLVAFIVTYVGSSLLLNSNNKTDVEKTETHTKKDIYSFTTKFIKEVNSNNKDNNYIVSPYSVEVALSMLKEGANGNTKKQINKVIQKEKTNIDNKNVKLANALFIRDIYKDKIKESFTNTLKKKYKSDLLVDEFKTPDVINNWVKEKTDGMIPETIDDTSENFLLAIVNVISINTKWKYKFECENTEKEEFINNDKKLDVEMMSQSYDKDIKYINDDVKGIMLPYNEDLEFIGLMPDKGLNKFIDNLDNKSLYKYLNSFKKIKKKQKVDLSLPRFTYEYDFEKFKDSLEKIGIKDAFDKDNANFTNIMTKKDMKEVNAEDNNIYITKAIHKAKVELNESGTKAAAVTYSGMQWDSIEEKQPKSIKIKFNKPFMYIIRDKKSKEILFFGAVYEPNKWNGSTCED